MAAVLAGILLGILGRDVWSVALRRTRRDELPPPQQPRRRRLRSGRDT